MHSGYTMACIIYHTLEDYSLLKKLHCVTTDNAFNNYALTMKLSKKLQDDATIHWDHETQHFPCLIHIINLVVRKLLSVIKAKPSFRLTQVIDYDHGDGLNEYLDTDIDFILEDFPAANATGFRSMLSLLLHVGSSLRCSNKR